MLKLKGNIGDIYVNPEGILGMDIRQHHNHENDIIYVLMCFYKYNNAFAEFSFKSLKDVEKAMQEINNYKQPEKTNSINEFKEAINWALKLVNSTKEK